MRRFESFFPCQKLSQAVKRHVIECAVIRAMIEIYAVSRIGPSFNRTEAHAATERKFKL